MDLILDVEVHFVFAINVSPVSGSMSRSVSIPMSSSRGLRKVLVVVVVDVPEDVDMLVDVDVPVAGGPVEPPRASSEFLLPHRCGCGCGCGGRGRGRGDRCDSGRWHWGCNWGQNVIRLGSASSWAVTLATTACRGEQWQC